ELTQPDAVSLNGLRTAYGAPPSVTISITSVSSGAVLIGCHPNFSENMRHTPPGGHSASRGSGRQRNSAAERPLPKFGRAHRPPGSLPTSWSAWPQPPTSNQGWGYFVVSCAVSLVDKAMKWPAVHTVSKKQITHNILNALTTATSSVRLRYRAECPQRG